MQIHLTQRIRHLILEFAPTRASIVSDELELGAFVNPDLIVAIVTESIGDHFMTDSELAELVTSTCRKSAIAEELKATLDMALLKLRLHSRHSSAAVPMLDLLCEVWSEAADTWDKDDTGILYFSRLAREFIARVRKLRTEDFAVADCEREIRLLQGLNNILATRLDFATD